MFGRKQAGERAPEVSPKPPTHVRSRTGAPGSPHLIAGADVDKKSGNFVRATDQPAAPGIGHAQHGPIDALDWSKAAEDQGRPPVASCSGGRRPASLETMAREKGGRHDGPLSRSAVPLANRTRFKCQWPDVVQLPVEPRIVDGVGRRGTDPYPCTGCRLERLVSCARSRPIVAVNNDVDGGRVRGRRIEGDTETVCMT